MNAMRNLVHFLLLAGLGVLGGLFTLKCVFTPAISFATLWAAASWWLWFAGYALVTTSFITKLKSAWTPLVVHVATLLGLQMLPSVFPLTVLRHGLDLLRF